MRHALKKKILFVTIAIIIVVITFSHPEMRGVRPYDCIPRKNILENLHEEIAINFTSSAITHCVYDEMLFDEASLSPELMDGDLIEGHRIKDGGEYAPIECKPKYSTAVIVPYRDRAEELRGFLVYMHNFLHHQQIHYRIYVVEQLDTRPFNRAMLLNIGAEAAIKAGYPCLILHDVDLLPLKPANLYVLPYMNIFGGVIAMISKQYKAVNGMSNEYFGYGGEDEDLYLRLQSKELRVCRFESQISRYHALEHSTQPKYNKSNKLLTDAKERIASDGLSSLRYSEVATVLHPFFTHIMVDL